MMMTVVMVKKIKIKKKTEKYWSECMLAQLLTSGLGPATEPGHVKVTNS